MFRRTALLATMCVLLFSGAALAQTGVVMGTVVDSKGLPVEAARVSLWADGVCTGTFVMTDLAGLFVFENVAVGTYSIHAGKKTVGSVVLDGVVVSDGQVTDAGTLILVGKKQGGKVLPHANGR
jgi:hypothetical protein